MYSWEIDTLMKIKNCLLEVEEYCKICDTSPQISRIKYDAFNNTFEIWTNDNYYWNFKLEPVKVKRK